MNEDFSKHYPLDLDRLPPRWVWAFLGDVIADIQPGFPSGRHNSDGVGIPHLRPMNIDRAGRIDLAEVKYVETHDGARLRARDVIFNNTNSPVLIGKTASFDLPGEWAFSNHMTRLRPPEGLSHKFVAYQLHFLWMTGYFRHRCTHHVNQASISSGTLARTVPIMLAPTAEQRRIVAAIEEQFSRIDAGVEALQRARRNLQRMRAAVLQAAVVGRLLPQEPNDEPAESLVRAIRERRDTQRVSETVGQRLLPIPKGWCWTTLPAIGELDRGRSRHRPRNDPRLFGGPYPFIQTAEVVRSNPWIRSFSKTYNEEGLAQSRLWPKGTLCITIAANIAHTGILSSPACFPDSVVGFIYDGDPVTVRFIELFLRTRQQDLDRLAPATAQKNINLKVLTQLAIPLPPLSEQRRIVSEVDRGMSIIDGASEIFLRSHLRSWKLRQAILAAAFCGRLVPQESSEEPTYMLIDRIAATNRRRDKTSRRISERNL